ncbi:MAG: VCBS repeat-containing protein, partial [Myxococcota bacterium]
MNRLLFLGAAIGSLWLVACNDLQNLQVGQCGNGVVEDGEDCDLFVEDGQGMSCGAATDPTEQRCRFKCSTTATTTGDTSACPIGWSCNRSGVCQYASGQFIESVGSPVDLANQDIQIGDFDGDGSNDLIGFTENSVSVRFGSGNGQFITSYNLAIPTVEGRPTVGRLNHSDPNLDDNNDDVLVPLNLGLLVLSGQTDSTLAPMASTVGLPPSSFASAIRAIAVPVPPPPFSAALSALVIVDADPNADPGPDSGVRIFANETQEPDLILLGSSSRDSANLTQVPVADLAALSGDPELDGHEFALGFPGDDRVFVLGIRSRGSDPEDRAEFDVDLIETVMLDPSDQVADEGVRFADVDGDGELDLVIAVERAKLTRIAVAPGQGGGQFNDPIIDPRFEALVMACEAMDNEDCTEVPVGIGDLQGNGRADFVFPSGVVLSDTSGGLVVSYLRQSPEPWSEAVVADFNGDSYADIAAIAEGEAAVDFLLGDGAGQFTAVRAITSGFPYSLRVGDFDGNFISDLAFAETRNLESFVSVAFGEPFTTPSTPVVMGRFPQANYLEVIETGF